MPLHIDYFMHPSSPWTYLGSRRLRELAARVGAGVTVHPMDLSQVFPVSGGLPLPQRAPQRQAYRLVELQRWCAYLGIELVLEPPYFPPKSQLAALAIVAVREAGGDALAVSEAFLRALWAERRDIDDRGTVQAILDASEHDGAELIGRAGTEEIAQAYQADTRLAIQRGVFGAPTYVLDDELFWGQDRIDLLAWRIEQSAGNR